MKNISLLSTEESAALRLCGLRGAQAKGDGITFIPDKLMTPHRRKAVGRGGNLIEIKPWADVTGVQYHRGYAVLDRRARYAARNPGLILP